MKINEVQSLVFTATSQAHMNIVDMRRMDDCIIFGSIPPPYSKTERRTFAHAYAKFLVSWLMFTAGSSALT